MQSEFFSIPLQLSILEYRKRKQITCNDGNESHKEEANVSESPPRAKTDSVLGVSNLNCGSTKDNFLPVKKSSDYFSELNADESNTDLSTDGD